MPRITKIERQKKNGVRWSIYVDDEFLAGCNAEMLAALNIHEGDDISDDRLRQIKTALDTGNIRQKALGYLSRRSRSVAEMQKYLEQKEFAAEQIVSTIAWLQERKYLNDAQFADDWVKSRMQLAPRGRQRLLLELFQKGIDKATANSAIDAYLTSDSEADVAYGTILRHKKRWHGAEWLEIERKIYNFLSYRGFSGEAIIAACRRYREEVKKAELDSE